MKWRSLNETSATLDVRPLHEQFAERKRLIAKYVPAEIQALHARAISDIASAIKPLTGGDHAPAFELQDHNGKIISSAELLQKAALVLCFFRGRWCPFCVGQMEAMNSILPQLQQAEAMMVGISPQTVPQSFFMADQYKLQFPLLSDTGNGVARKFGLCYVVPDYQQAVYRRALVNLPFIHGDDSWTLPVPATYLVDRGGVIRYASVNADYTERPEPAEIVQAAMNLS